MKNLDFTRILFLVASLIIVFLGIVVAVIPESHFMVLIIVGVLFIVSVAVLDIQAAKIANLSESNPKVKTMRLLNRLTIAFIICLIFIRLSPIKSLQSAKINEIIFVGLLSIFFMVFGNFSPKIPFNRYFGLRLPWTVNDEDTWKVAHKILGYLSFPISMGMFILTLYFSADKIVPVCIGLWVGIPGIYSFFFYNKKKKEIDAKNKEYVSSSEGEEDFQDENTRVGNEFWPNFLKTKGLVILSIIINLVAYKYLPDQIGMQTDLKGNLNNYVSKNAIVMMPIILGVMSYYYSENSNKLKGLAAQVIFLLVNIAIIFSNIKL